MRERRVWCRHDYDYRLIVEDRLNKRERAKHTCRCGTSKCRGSLLDDR